MYFIESIKTFFCLFEYLNIYQGIHNCKIYYNSQNIKHENSSPTKFSGKN